MQNTSWVGDGYILDESDPDILILRRSNGTFVAAFSATAATKELILQTLEKDAGADVHRAAGGPESLRRIGLSGTA